MLIATTAARQASRQVARSPSPQPAVAVEGAPNASSADEPNGITSGGLSRRQETVEPVRSSRLFPLTLGEEPPCDRPPEPAPRRPLRRSGCGIRREVSGLLLHERQEQATKLVVRHWACGGSNPPRGVRELFRCHPHRTPGRRRANRSRLVDRRAGGLAVPLIRVTRYRHLGADEDVAAVRQ